MDITPEQQSAIVVFLLVLAAFLIVAIVIVGLRWVEWRRDNLIHIPKPYRSTHRPEGTK